MEKAGLDRHSRPAMTLAAGETFKLILHLHRNRRNHTVLNTCHKSYMPQKPQLMKSFPTRMATSVMPCLVSPAWPWRYCGYIREFYSQSHQDQSGQSLTVHT